MQQCVLHAGRVSDQLALTLLMGLACQVGYIALRCKNSELYDNQRKNSSIYLFNAISGVVASSTDSIVGNRQTRIT
jgi:hypothetical protein